MAQNFIPDWVMILAGAVNGIGSALLWNAQGTLIIDYSERGVNGGKIFAIFWAYFNVSAMVGGVVSFLYFGNHDGEASAGLVQLYAIFLSFLVLGVVIAALTLVDPEFIRRENLVDETKYVGEGDIQVTEVEMAQHQCTSSIGKKDTTPKAHWYKDIIGTLNLFVEKRTLALIPLFFYTGYKQGYQIVTFGDRFFDSSTLGLEVLLFYTTDMLGGVVAGRLLDGEYFSSTATNIDYAEKFVIILVQIIKLKWKKGTMIENIYTTQLQNSAFFFM
eukprot:CAMPEP_0113300320 /NCGR_PEP_ID=MMETSP0010_2-20120614/2001_1 /TAXON_ID=216773 ORGANISM="Corethron hystrix, Strain 308" /NCGR_SAMPLE_ID=MMETSP0010_2 /ASSEMBLY_ACC=CAM_ASM_000155 /LENGTH=273 /DNA_ID=CAMNT_0000153729 /DNA_START=394 /DNA_END=1216 /DNA_ORIENTATION=- /assembly_acc=CAM_ASM_000155